MPKDPLATIPEAFVEPVESFLAWLELERGLSRHTIDAYARDLAQCADYLHQKEFTDWNAVDETAVSGWTASLSEAQYARSSQARKLSAVRMLARHLVREGIRPDDFTELASAPKLSRKLPEVLTRQELELLLEAPATNTPHGLRDRAILELFYSSGLRVSELCGVLLQSINLDDGYVRVFGKGAKERIAPIGSAAITAVRNAIGENKSGRWIVADIKAGPDFESNKRNPVLPLMYSMSVMYCMNSALSEEGGAGLGTLGLHEQKLTELVTAGGFSSVEGHEFDFDSSNRYYDIT